MHFLGGTEEKKEISPSEDLLLAEIRTELLQNKSVQGYR
jgi:hypothetical protein